MCVQKTIIRYVIELPVRLSKPASGFVRGGQNSQGSGWANKRANESQPICSTPLIPSPEHFNRSRRIRYYENWILCLWIYLAGPVAQKPHCSNHNLIHAPSTGFKPLITSLLFSVSLVSNLTISPPFLIP